jgi:hypothetical protein
MRKALFVGIAALVTVGWLFPQGNAQTKPAAKAGGAENSRVPQIQITEKPLPTVKDAISRAIDHTTAYQLFLKKSIEIAATKEPDGTVKVVFSRPTSDIIATEGRLPIKPVVEVQFTEKDVPATRPEQKRQAELQQRADALAKAVRAVCSEVAVGDKVEFAVRASKDEDGFSVLVERIPYTPGAHTLYQVSNRFEIVDVSPGE